VKWFVSNKGFVEDFDIVDETGKRIATVKDTYDTGYNAEQEANAIVSAHNAEN